VILFRVDAGVPPSCAGDWTLESHAFQAPNGGTGLSAAPASCGCSCSAPFVDTSVCGSAIQLDTFSGTNCTSCNVGVMCQQGGTGLNTDCTALPSSTVRVRGHSKDAGTLACIGNPSVQKPTPTWSGAARACDPAIAFGPGCNVNEVCPRPLPPGAELCVESVTLTSCPAGYPNGPRTYFKSFSDTRNCMGCTCGSTSPVICGGTVDVFDDIACQLGTFIGSAVDTCIVTGQPIRGALWTAAVNSPTCGPPSNTGFPTGGVTASGPAYTYCCR
jgi:hypothetical protein